jgi:hypothetical protein
MSARTFGLAAVLALSAAGAYAVAGERSTCLDSKLTFESSALERLVREPDRVLKTEDRFWAEEPAQKYTDAWAESNGFTISREKWRNRLARFAELDEADRLSSPLMHTAGAILADRKETLWRALRHVCDFLPEQTDTGVPIYLTAFIPPRAFVTGGIVVNVSAPYWNGNADNILNSVVHEIWHVGYSRLRESRTEAPLEHPPLYGMLEQLQNEGTATYVAYRARSDFPAPDEADFRALDTPADVTRALEEVNRLFGRVGAVSEKRIAKLSWKTGVDGRAYYVAGAHMARTIDGSRGRAELLRTVTAGPVSFVAAYNDVAPEGRRIDVPDADTIARRGAGPGSPVLVVLIAVAVLCLGILFFVLRKALV